VGKLPCGYILSSKRNGTLYVGVASDLVKRVYEHEHDLMEGLTKEYGTHTLVRFERHKTMGSTIPRGKRINTWNRSWELRLIEESNSEWRDLYEDIV